MPNKGRSNPIGGESAPMTAADQLNQSMRDNQDMRKELANLHARLDKSEAHALSAPQTTAAADGLGMPSISDLDIRHFLAHERPECEYFNLALCTYQMQVFVDTKTDSNAMTGAETRRPALWMEMKRWRGPGAEFATPGNHLSSDKFRRIGHWSAVNSPLVRVTEADIKEFHLLPPDATDYAIDSLVRNDGKFTIAEVIERVAQDKDYQYGRIISGEAYRLMAQADYDKKWATEAISKEAEKKMAALSPQALKGGIPAGVAQ